MAESTLNLDERFRPWHECGLRYVLMEPSADSCVSAPDSFETADTAAAPSVASGSSSPDQSVPTNALELGPDPNTWPEPWASFWAKTTQPSATVWTYWNLGRDMTQGPDIRRRKVLKDMIANLCWPQGSVSFWPFTMPQGTDLAAQVANFLAGIAAIKASLVVTFGQELVELLVPNALASRRRDEIFFIRGKAFVLLVMPDLQDLAAMDQQNLQAVCQQLAALRESV